MKRFRALLLAAAVCSASVALAACGGGGSGGSTNGSGSSGEGGGTDTVSIVVPVPGETTFFYPYIVGKELGFFEQEHVKVDYVSSNSEVPLPAFVANGNADVAAAGAEEVLTEEAKGGEFAVIYDETLTSADGISVLDESEIKSVKELEGKKVGIGGQDDRSNVQTALEVEGVDPGSVQTVNVGGGSPTVAKALESGTVAAYASGLFNLAVTEAVGGVKLRSILPEELENRPAASFVVTTKELEGNRDALVRFVRAWTMASYLAQVDPGVVEAICREKVPDEWKNEELAQNILKIAIDGRNPGKEPWGTIRREDWETVQTLMTNAGSLSKEVDLSALLNEELIEEVNEFDHGEVEAAAAKWEAAHPGA